MADETLVADEATPQPTVQDQINAQAVLMRLVNDRLQNIEKIDDMLSFLNFTSLTSEDKNNLIKVRSLLISQL